MCRIKVDPRDSESTRNGTVLIEGATEGSGVLVSKDGNLYTVLTAWHVLKVNHWGRNSNQNT